MASKPWLQTSILLFRAQRDQASNLGFNRMGKSVGKYCFLFFFHFSFQHFGCFSFCFKFFLEATSEPNGSVESLRMLIIFVSSKLKKIKIKTLMSNAWLQGLLYISVYGRLQKHILNMIWDSKTLFSASSKLQRHVRDWMPRKNTDYSKYIAAANDLDWCTNCSWFLDRAA